jgi:hypothetical protein
MAQSGHAELHRTCPLSGVKRTSSFSIGDYAAPMHVGPVEVQIAFDLRPAIGGLSLIAFGKPDFHITGRGAGQRRDHQLRRSPLANAMSG